MKKLALYFICIFMSALALAQENPKRDSILHRKTKQPPDTSFTNPIYEGPAEIDSINRTDSVNRRKRANPIDRYREDSTPRLMKKGILY